MIDIHCHLLAGVDDGPATWDTVMEMVAQGMEDGIEGAVATSHILDRLGPEVDRLYQAKFQELKERIEQAGLTFQVFLGAEIFFQFGLEERVGNLHTATFNGNGVYFLLELPLAFSPPSLDEVVFRSALRASGLFWPIRNAMPSFREISIVPRSCWNAARFFRSTEEA